MYCPSMYLKGTGRKPQINPARIAQNISQRYPHTKRKLIHNFIWYSHKNQQQQPEACIFSPEAFFHATVG